MSVSFVPHYIFLVKEIDKLVQHCLHQNFLNVVLTANLLRIF